MNFGDLADLIRTPQNKTGEGMFLEVRNKAAVLAFFNLIKTYSARMRSTKIIEPRAGTAMGLAETVAIWNVKKPPQRWYLYTASLDCK